MAEPRFRELQEELLRAGVAPRHARRAVVEMQDHFQQLMDEAIARGASEPDARIAAHRRVGMNLELVHQYAARAELRAWSRRWPWLCFTIVPLFIYLVVGFAALWGVSSLGRAMRFHLNQMLVTPAAAPEIDFAVRVAFLWCLPLCVAAGFTLLAARRRVALRWPLVCSVSVGVLASLCNVAVKIAAGRGLGEITAGIGFSSETLPGQSLHAAVLVALSLALLWTWRRPPRGRALN